MMPPGPSVIFDRVAGCYDQTRALPAPTVAAQTAQLAAQVTGPGGPGGPVLEIGVGTGRVAVPLAGAAGAAGTGLRVLGVDLSAPMLGELAAKESAVSAVLADVTRLPLRDRSAGAVIACHVLHLITGWQTAVTEAIRVLRPGGLLLAERGRDDGSGGELRRRIRAAAGMTDGSAGLDDLDELDEFMRERGARARHLPPIANPATRTAEQYLRQVRDNTYSWTWAIPQNARLHAVRVVTAWVRQELGDPGEVMLAAGPVRWRSYRLP